VRRLALLLVLAIAGAAPAGAAPPRALVQRGNHLYGQYCIACHGAAGVGRLRATSGAGPLRNQTTQRGIGPPLRGVGALAADFYLRTGYMPLRRVGVQPRRSRVLFSDRQIDALVAYVASLAPGPPVPRPHPERGSLSQGLELFTEHCAGCHQVVAQGGYVGEAVAPPLDQATPTQVAQAVRIGPYVMPKFSKRAISDEELNSIVRYVQYAAKDPSNKGGWGIGFIGPVPEGIVTWWIAGTALVGLCILIGRRLRS
jgi:ubiquinol-cytochrome c reductase cytochrome c subunit